MSLAVCYYCDRPIDTDFKGEGEWDGTEYKCEDCTSGSLPSLDPTGELKKQDDYYAELHGDTPDSALEPVSGTQEHDVEFWKRRADQRQETINEFKRNPPDTPDESQNK